MPEGLSGARVAASGATQNPPPPAPPAGPFPDDVYFRRRVRGEFPDRPEQWYLHNIGHLRNTDDLSNAEIGFILQGWDGESTNERSTFDADIDAPEGWNYLRSIATQPRETIVAVLDSGVDWLHPDLINRMWTNPGEIPGNGLDDDRNGYIDDVHGYDFGERDGDPMDLDGHGTHVAGIIAAEHNNNIGIAGINPYAKIMAIRIENDAGQFVGIDAIIEAIEYSVRMGATVANYSWGYNGPPDSTSAKLTEAIRRAGASGQFISIAAANDNNNNDIRPFWPANVKASNAVAVASSTALERLSGFSNYGVTRVDVVAPGSDIISTHPRFATPGFYSVKPGTSMAAPMVAGIASALKSADPSLSPAQIRQRILAGVDAFPAYSEVSQTGGRVNLFNSLHTASDSLSQFRLTPQWGADSLYSFSTDTTTAFEWDDGSASDFFVGSFFTSENIPIFAFDFVPFKKSVSGLSFHLKITEFDSPDASESYQLVYLRDVTPDALRDRRFLTEGSVTHRSLTSGLSCGVLRVAASQADGGMASLNLPIAAVRALNAHRRDGGGPALFSLRPISISNTNADQNISFDPEASYLQVDLSQASPGPVPVIGVTVSPAVVTEDGTQNLVFTFRRSGATSAPLTVDYTVAGTARGVGSTADPADYGGLPAGSGPLQIRFAAGASTATLSLDPISDARQEPEESVVINAVPGAGYSIGSEAVATGRIRDDDLPLPSLSLSATRKRVQEGADQPLVFTLRRTGPLNRALAVTCSIGGTATRPGSDNPSLVDYSGIAAAPVDPVVRFAAGSATATVEIVPIDDLRTETDETIRLTLRSSNVYRITGSSSASVVIVDDDQADSEFSNSQPIQLADNGKSSPYPSTLQVDGLTGLITDVNVTLRGLTHTFPADLDILLVSPAGQKVMLMSDCGGSDDLTGVELRFDQSAAGALPEFDVITSGTYLPTNAGTAGSDPFASPAPAGPYGSDLSAFNGSSPNGQWRLFVMDDSIVDQGTLSGGWSLDITTAT